MSVPLKFVREGIRYDDLSEDEKDDWDELDWGEDEDGNPLDPPDEVDAAQLNKCLFNEDTVDKVLEHLMTDGHQGRWRRPARQDDHLRQEPAPRRLHLRTVHRQLPAPRQRQLRPGHHPQRKYAQSLIDDFSDKDKAPHIAISVDMLDTGIDVPEVVNLVFFKLVRSKTKFWQMIGRGTRLCPDLFGPGDDKTDFNVFDFCQNLEFFSQDLPEPAGSVPSRSASGSSRPASN